jgi:hypothetical protein
MIDGCMQNPQSPNPKSEISPRDNLPHSLFPEKRELLPKINEMTRDKFLMVERRKSQRFKLHNDNFVIHARSIGKIEDISLGGLCCTCINDDLDPASDSRIDIRCPHALLYVPDIGIEIMETAVSGGASIFNVFTRTCHIKFQELTDDQLQQVHSLILHNVTGTNDYPAGTTPCRADSNI